MSNKSSFILIILTLSTQLNSMAIKSRANSTKVLASTSINRLSTPQIKSS